MPWWADIIDGLGLLAIVAAGVFVFLFARRRWLSRGGATFECSLRTEGSAAGEPSGRGWMLGLGRYSGSTLQWFRVFSFSPWPKRAFDRGLEVTDRRTPHGPEAFALYAGHVVVSVRLYSGEVVELAMSERALTSFLAWTEAAPPGSRPLPPRDSSE